MHKNIFGIPVSETADIKIFHTTGSSSNWEPWNKPRGKSMCFMIAIGSGGGGGAGLTGATSTVRGGGGGGGSGAIARCIMPMWAMPDLCYVQVGLGGVGGNSSAASGNGGQRTYISIRPGFSAQADLLLQSGATQSGGGFGGSTAGSNAGGSAETISSDTLGLLSVFGIHQYIAGRLGAASGASGGATGGANAIFSNVPLTGGGGGGTVGVGNADQQGGAQSPNGSIFFGPPATAAGTTGTGGYLLQKPFVSYGGCGGGGSGAGTGGAGGNGAIGSGGGGGGGGITFGPGGTGGDGLCIIISW